jgi:hypothetical protein
MLGDAAIRAVASSWSGIVDEIRRSAHPLAAWLTDEVAHAIGAALQEGGGAS